MNIEKEYSFTLVKKGYDPEEVSSYIDELQGKYSRLYSHSMELEQKLDTARRLIRRFTDMENGLRQNIADSKRAAAAMLSDTKARSDALLDRTRESCGEIISELDMQITQRMNAVDEMKTAAQAFKEQLFELYSSHIELIESIATGAETFTYEPDYTKVADAVEDFESAGEPRAELPKFEEYPEDSMFDDLLETDGETSNTEASEQVNESEEDKYVRFLSNFANGDEG